MATAQLLDEHLPQFCSTTNHYECSDGTYLLVTVPTFDSIRLIEETTGIVIPVSVSHLPQEVDVFLSDLEGSVLDADGDPSNGMTPHAVFPAGTSFAEALAGVGYSLI